MPGLFRNKVLDLDGALLQVSLPDKHGYCSLGVSVGLSRAALEMPSHICVQINPQIPARTATD